MAESSSSITDYFSDISFDCKVKVFKKVKFLLSLGDCGSYAYEENHNSRVTGCRNIRTAYNVMSEVWIDSILNAAALYTKALFSVQVVLLKKWAKKKRRK